MTLTEVDAITAYCRMLNTRRVEHLVPLLAEDFVYESQVVLQPLHGVPDFVAYITGKFATIAAANHPAFAELGRFFDRPVREYSTGMYVRLAFSAAIHQHPETLVVDEALAVGDARFFGDI